MSISCFFKNSEEGHRGFLEDLWTHGEAGAGWQGIGQHGVGWRGMGQDGEAQGGTGRHRAGWQGHREPLGRMARHVAG